MTRQVVLALSFLAVAACNHQSGGVAGAANASEERKARLLANLKNEFPSLDELDISLGKIERTPYGMDEVEVTITGPQGPQKQMLLVSPDDKKLYVVMRGPIDATKSAAELQAKKAEENKARAQELESLAKTLPARGNPNAKTTVIEFSDFQCPYCRRGFESVEELLDKRSQDVRFVFMHYPLSFHPWAMPAAIASTCAGEQKADAFWRLHDAYFENQSTLTPENVLDKSAEYLATSGLDMQKWNTCARDTSSPAHQAAQKQVEAQMALGEKYGVSGTPAFFINGELISGAVPPEELERRL